MHQKSSDNTKGRWENNPVNCERTYEKSGNVAPSKTLFERKIIQQQEEWNQRYIRKETKGKGSKRQAD